MAERVDQQGGYGLRYGAANGVNQKAEDAEKLVGGLFEQITILKMEVDWLKKLQTFD